MHAVAPEISPAHEHDDSSRPAPSVRVGDAQTFALRAIQRAVVEIKMQIPDRAAFLVAYLPVPVHAARINWVVIELRQRVRQCAKRKHGRTLEAGLRPFDRL